MLEGLPAGVPISPRDLTDELARRRQGHGRGGRQRFERDRFEILAGVRHGRTIGSPIGVTIPNQEFDAKYAELMGVEGATDPAQRLTRPRPGHADLAGAQKYGFDDVRNVLERASARETAARVAAGTFCKAFLAGLGVQVVSHVVRIGKVKAAAGANVPAPEDLAAVDGSPVRCFDPAVSKAMVARDRSTAEGAGHGRRGVRGPRVRRPARPGLLRAVRSQARRAPGDGPHEHPVRQGRGGGRRVRHGGRARARKAHDEIVLAGGRIAPQDGPCGRDRGRDEHRASRSACGRR